MKSNTLYIAHILECINRIEQYASAGKEAFLQQTLLQDAVYRNLEIIGEAAKKLDSTFRDEHAALPWRSIIGLRNVLIHAYEGIDPEEIWQVVEESLPSLKNALQPHLNKPYAP